MNLAEKMCKAVDRWPDGLDGKLFFCDKEIHEVYSEYFYFSSFENEFLEKHCDSG